MLGKNYFFTSESVTEGHPDKIADQVSDAILDSILAKDPFARVACETLVTTGLAFVAGEVTTNCYVEIPDIVRETIKDIGYTRAKYGFDYETCAVITSVHGQSSDIAVGVDIGGAGDQGLMFGYAWDQTPERMPLPISLAHHIMQRLAELRRSGAIRYLRPDSKSQVSVEYVDGRPTRIATIVVSTQHAADAVESGEVGQELADWWTRFQDADGEERARMLLPEQGGDKKRRRRRKKPGATQGAPAGGGATE